MGFPVAQMVISDTKSQIQETQRTTCRINTNKNEKMTPRHIKKHLIKTVNEKPTTNIIVNGEKFKAFPLRLSIRQACPLLPPLFDIPRV